MTHDLALRLSPAAILRKAGLEPYPWQVKAATDPAPRLLFLTSRQAGKSTVSAAIALHTALFTPGGTVLLVAPTLRQSQELARKVRTFAKALELRLESESSLRLELAGGGRVLALPGSEDTIRGYSANLIIIDEAAWVSDDLYTALRPMLAITQGRLIAISTPFGTRGWFWRAWHEEGEAWKRYRVTAYDIPSISEDFLEQERRALGELMFRQEYLAEFIGTGGAIPEEHIRRAVRLEGPTPPQPGRVYVAGLDLARLQDWTSVSVLDVTESPYFLTFHERWQGDWSYTEARVLDVLRRYNARVTVDATGVGDPVFERIRRQWPQAHPFRFTSQSKTELINELRLTLAEERLLLYPEPVLLGELTALQARQTAYGVSYEAPAGAHDDTVMSLALALWTVRGAPPSYDPIRVRSKWT